MSSLRLVSAYCLPPQVLHCLILYELKMGWDPCVRGRTVGTRLGLKAWESCRYLAIYIVAAKSKYCMCACLCTNNVSTVHLKHMAKQTGATLWKKKKGDLLWVNKSEHHACAEGGNPPAGSLIPIPSLSFHHTHTSQIIAASHQSPHSSRFNFMRNIWLTWITLFLIKWVLGENFSNKHFGI